MIRQIVILTLLLAAAAVCRFWIFRLQDKDIAPDYYQRKARLEDYVFGAGQAPPGFKAVELLPGGRPSPSRLTPTDLATMPVPRPVFPAADRIQETLAAAYVNTLGDQVVLVVCRYDAAAKAEPAPEGFRREGVFLVTATTTSPLLRDSVLDSLFDRIAKLEKNAVKLNKLKTIGNVLLKFLMNLLVGTFAFVLMLFVVKYFLIIRQIEG